MNTRWLLTFGLIVALAGGLWWWSGGQAPTVAQAGAQSGPDIRKQYPGLLESYEDAAARWNRMVPDQPMKLIRVLHPQSDREQIRWANLWLMSRMLSLANTDADAYPPGTFSDITSRPVAGQAFVLVRMGQMESMIVFSPMPQAPGRWQRGLLVPFSSVCKLGGALALAQDFLAGARDGQPLDRFSEGIRGKWLKDPPQVWTLLGIKDPAEPSVSLFAFEQALPEARSAQLGFWITTQSARRHGLNLQLRWQPGRNGWSGWRVTGVERTDQPAPPHIVSR